jgi:DNA polymerase-3 subunit beta
MKITCKQQDLHKGLSIVGHAVSSRSTLPILGNILLATDHGRLKLAATNLEIGITHYIEATIHEEGSTTLPAKTFSELIGSLASGDVHLTVNESHSTNVKTAKNNANVKGMAPDEYPAIPGADNTDASITLYADTLKKAIAQVAFAAAQDESRPVLTGVLVETRDNTISFAAADSFRLALRTIPFSEQTELPSNTLIPAKTLLELARILPPDGPVQAILTPNRSQVLFHTEHIDLVSRLIEGTFPNIRAAIPQHLPTRVVVETKEFANAVKMVSPFAKDSSNITKVKVSRDSIGGTLTLEATAADVGDNTVTINAAIEGPDTNIIFNTVYLADVLAVIDKPEVSLELNTPTNPGLIKPVGSDDYTYVIMPMSTNR